MHNLFIFSYKKLGQTKIRSLLLLPLTNEWSELSPKKKFLQPPFPSLSLCVLILITIAVILKHQIDSPKTFLPYFTLLFLFHFNYLRACSFQLQNPSSLSNSPKTYLGSNPHKNSSPKTLDPYPDSALLKMITLGR